MNVCARCNKYKGCFERRGICTAYDPVDYDKIRKALQTEMQSAKSSQAAVLAAENSGHDQGADAEG